MGTGTDTETDTVNWIPVNEFNLDDEQSKPRN